MNPPHEPKSHKSSREDLDGQKNGVPLKKQNGRRKPPPGWGGEEKKPWRSQKRLQKSQRKKEGQSQPENTKLSQGKEKAGCTPKGKKNNRLITEKGKGKRVGVRKGQWSQIFE